MSSLVLLINFTRCCVLRHTATNITTTTTATSPKVYIGNVLWRHTELSLRSNKFHNSLLRLLTRYNYCFVSLATDRPTKSSHWRPHALSWIRILFSFFSLPWQRYTIKLQYSTNGNVTEFLSQSEEECE